MALQDSHQLIQVRTSLPAGRKQKQDFVEEIARKYGCDPKKISAGYDTLAAPLKPIRTLQAQSKSFAKNGTWCWDVGWRIFPNNCFDELVPQIQDQKAECDDLFREFMDDYESTVQESISESMGAAVIDDFPTREKMLSSYKFEIHLAEVPSPEIDPRAGWSSEQIRSMKESSRIRYESAVKDATVEMLGRIEEPLKKLSERMGAYTGGREGSFNDSIVGNIEDVIGEMISGNLLDEPEIKNLHGRILRGLNGVTPEALRSDENLRDAVEKRAASLAVDARELIERVATCEGLAL